MAIRGKWNNSATKNDKNQISSYVSSRPKWLPSTEIWGPWDKYPGRRSCRRNQVTWYKSEQSDWFGINYHIGILVYRDMNQLLCEIFKWSGKSPLKRPGFKHIGCDFGYSLCVFQLPFNTKTIEPTNTLYWFSHDEKNENNKRHYILLCI